MGRNEVFVQVPEPIHVGSQEKGGVLKDFSTLSLCLYFCVEICCLLLKLDSSTFRIEIVQEEKESNRF